MSSESLPKGRSICAVSSPPPSPLKSSQSFIHNTGRLTHLSIDRCSSRSFSFKLNSYLMERPSPFTSNEPSLPSQIATSTIATPFYPWHYTTLDLVEDADDEHGLHPLARIPNNSMPPTPVSASVSTTPLDHKVHASVELPECTADHQRMLPLSPKDNALSVSCPLSSVSPRIIPATKSAMNGSTSLLMATEDIKTGSEPALRHCGIPGLPENAQDYVPLCTEIKGAIPVYLWPETWQGILGFLDFKTEQYDSVLPYFRQSTTIAKGIWMPRHWDVVAFPKPLTTRRPFRSLQHPADLTTPPSTPKKSSSTQGQRRQALKRRVEEDGASAMILRIHPTCTVNSKNSISPNPHMVRNPQFQGDQGQRRCLQENELETMETSSTDASTIASETLTASTPSIPCMLSSSQVQREPPVNGNAQGNEVTGIVLKNSPLQQVTSRDSQRGPKGLGVNQTVLVGETSSVQVSGIPLAADLSGSTGTGATPRRPQHLSTTQAFDHRWERLYEQFVGTYPSKGRPRTLEPGQMIKIPGLGVLWNCGVGGAAHGTRSRSGVSTMSFRIDGGSPWSPLAGLNLTDGFSWEVPLALMPTAQTQWGNHPTNIRNNFWGQGIQSPSNAQPHIRSSSSIGAWHNVPSSRRSGHVYSVALSQRVEWTPPVQHGRATVTATRPHNPELSLLCTWARPMGLNSDFEQFRGPRGRNGYQFQSVLNSRSPTRLGRCATMPTCMRRPRSATRSRDAAGQLQFLPGKIDTGASYTNGNTSQTRLVTPRRTITPTSNMILKRETSPRLESSSKTTFIPTRRSCGSVPHPNNLAVATGQSDTERLVPSPLINQKELMDKQGSVVGVDVIDEELGATTSSNKLPVPGTESFLTFDGGSEMFTGITLELNEASISLSEAPVKDLATPAVDRNTPITDIGSNDKLDETQLSFPDVPAVESIPSIKDSETPASMDERKLAQIDTAATYIAPSISYANAVVTGIGPHLTDVETLMVGSEPDGDGNVPERRRPRLRGRRKWRALTNSDY